MQVAPPSCIFPESHLTNWDCPTLAHKPIPEISEGTANIVLPGILIGGPLLLGMIRLTAKRGGWEDTWPL